MSPSEQSSIDSTSQNSARKRQRLRKGNPAAANDTGKMLHSTIEETFSPRHTTATPRTANGSHKWHQGAEDEVQMSLLGPGERSAAFDDDALDAHEKPAVGLSKKDKKAMALLILLCVYSTIVSDRLLLILFTDLIQGVPVRTLTIISPTTS